MKNILEKLKHGYKTPQKKLDDREKDFMFGCSILLVASGILSYFALQPDKFIHLPLGYCSAGVYHYLARKSGYNQLNCLGILMPALIEASHKLNSYSCKFL